MVRDKLLKVPLKGGDKKGNYMLTKFTVVVM